MAIKAPIPAPLPAQKVARAVAAAGGRAWLVGGTVRDALLNRPANDQDLEAHGLEAERLQAVLSEVGTVRRVGRSFGVFKVRIGRDTLDVSLPRAESRAGDTRGSDAGEIRGDPHLGLEAAARRRDLSVNAMAWDPLTGEIADPCDGWRDLHERVLRAAWLPRFGDDPLRALRVVRFAGVLGFDVDPALAERCRTLDPGGEAPERQRMELDKLWMGAAAPGSALRLAADLGVLERVLPEVTPDTVAPVAEALDRAALQRGQLQPPARALAAMWGVVLHRCSTESATAALDRLRVFRQEGFAVRDAVLGSIGAWRAMASEPSDASLRRWAERADLGVACAVAAATGASTAGDAAARALHLGVSAAPLPPLLTGRDLSDIGVPAGPQMGDLLRRVRDAQLDGHVCDPDAAMALAERLWSSEACSGAATDQPASSDL